METITKISQLPTNEHWAVLIDESMQYDDGYGSRESSSYSTLNYVSYVAFKSEEDLRAWIEKNDESTYAKKVYRVIHVKPAAVRRHVTFDIER